MRTPDFYLLATDHWLLATNFERFPVSIYKTSSAFLIRNQLSRCYCSTASISWCSRFERSAIADLSKPLRLPAKAGWKPLAPIDLQFANTSPKVSENLPASRDAQTDASEILMHLNHDFSNDFWASMDGPRA